jgi:hypothetical protein
MMEFVCAGENQLTDFSERQRLSTNATGEIGQVHSKPYREMRESEHFEFSCDAIASHVGSRVVASHILGSCVAAIDAESAGGRRMVEVIDFAAEAAAVRIRLRDAFAPR